MLSARPAWIFKCATIYDAHTKCGELSCECESGTEHLRGIPAKDFLVVMFNAELRMGRGVFGSVLVFGLEGFTLLVCRCCKMPWHFPHDLTAHLTNAPTHTHIHSLTDYVCAFGPAFRTFWDSRVSHNWQIDSLSKGFALLMFHAPLSTTPPPLSATHRGRHTHTTHTHTHTRTHTGTNNSHIVLCTKTHRFGSDSSTAAGFWHFSESH